MSHLPRAWGRYRTLVGSTTLPSSAAFNRFAARYRMAGDLEMITFRTLAPRTGLGYAAIFRVGFAYTALESLEAAIGKSHGDTTRTPRTAVVAREVLEAVRSPRMTRFRELLLEETEGRALALRKRVMCVLDDPDNHNARPIAEKVRHLLFHGVLTVHGSGVNSQGTRVVLDQLSEAVMTATDDRFSSWVEQRENVDSI